MKLPKLAIKGAHPPLTLFVKSSMKSAGFLIAPCGSGKALQLSQDPLILMVWVSPQPTARNSAAEFEHEKLDTKIDPRKLHANVEIFCEASMPKLAIQMSYFIDQVASGKLSTTPSGQVWFGFPPPRPAIYDWIPGSRLFVLSA